MLIFNIYNLSLTYFFREKNKVICLSLIIFEYLAKKKKKINNPEERKREIKGDKFVSVNIFLEHLVPKLITRKKSEKKEGRDKDSENFSVQGKRVNIPHRFKKIYKHREIAPSTPTGVSLNLRLYRLDKFSKKISCTDFARFFEKFVRNYFFFFYFYFLY